jgi:hypothetical protein
MICAMIMFHALQCMICEVIMLHALNQAERRIVLSFRGTSDILDVLTDVQLLQTPLEVSLLCAHEVSFFRLLLRCLSCVRRS